MVMLEVMATGLPIIATDVGSNAEMIESGGGILISPMSSDAIVRAIERIRPKEIRTGMSIWNRNKAWSTYKDDKIFERIRKIYREVCG